MRTEWGDRIDGLNWRDSDGCKVGQSPGKRQGRSKMTQPRDALVLTWADCRCRQSTVTHGPIRPLQIFTETVGYSYYQL